MAEVRLEDGTIVTNVPEGITQQELLRALGREAPPQPSQLPPGLQGFLASEEPSAPTNLGGFFDALGSVGRGGLDLFGKALGGLAGGIAAAPVAFEPEAPDILSRVSEAVSAPFAASTEAGRGVSEALSFPFQALAKGADVLGELTPGGPGPQTAVKTTLLGIPALAAPGRQVARTGRVVGERPLTLKQNILQEAQAEGLVVPASDAVPTSVARGTVEGLAGKPRLNEQASFRNTQTFNDIAAKELGLPEGAEVTLVSLDAVRREAGKAYSVLENAGTISPTVIFRRDLAKATGDLRSASKEFPVLAKAESPVAAVIEMAQGLNKPTFQASSAITAIKVLRDKAKESFRDNKPKVGNAYRDISKALEDAAELHLSRVGEPAAVQAFKDARVRIAKSFSVEKALTGDGFVSAANLARQRSRRDPLTGGLDLIARFAEQFPKASKVVKTPPIQTGRLSAILAGLGLTGATLAGSPIAAIPMLALAFGGPATRASILSRFGQSTLAKPRPELTGVGAAELGILESALLADQDAGIQ